MRNARSREIVERRRPVTVTEAYRAHSERVRSKMDALAKELRKHDKISELLKQGYKGFVVTKKGDIKFLRFEELSNPVHVLRTIRIFGQRTRAKNLIPGKYIGDLTGVLDKRMKE